MQRDRAILLFDDVHEMERLAGKFVPQLSAGDFRELYNAFLSDFVSQLVNFSSVQTFLYTDNYMEQNRWFAALGKRGELRLMPDDEDSTLQILDSLFTDGYRRILILSFLNPIAPMRAIQTAFHLLQLEDEVVVLGPTQEHQLYLLGFKSLHEDFIKEFDPRLGHAYDDAVRALCKLDVSALSVEEWYDVLSISDLTRLRNDILKQVTENLPYPRRTREWLMHLEQKYELST